MASPVNDRYQRAPGGHIAGGRSWKGPFTTVAAGATQFNSCTVGAISWAIRLVGASASQANASAAGAVALRIPLSAAACAQSALSPGKAIGLTATSFNFAAANSAQANSSASVAVSAGVGTLSTRFTLTSTSTQASVGYTVGHAFKQGEVPAGQGISVGGASGQVTPKNYWPDGSLKFAIVAGLASVSPTPLTVTLSNGSFLAGTPLSIASLKGTGITASIGCGGMTKR